MNRLVSLAPSATATVAALDAADRLVGVTDHCAVESAPALGGWLNPDLDLLDALDPDLVLTTDALTADVRDAVRLRGYPSFHHEPTTLDDVIEGFAALGEAIELGDAGRELEYAARDRIERVRRATPDEPESRPTVYCEEWPDPPMSAGNWVPEAVEAAGGRYPFGGPGERSTPVAGSAVTAAAPEHVFVHHCGLGESAVVDLRSRWGLDATVHVLDDSLLNQPSPRLLEGVERMAEALHGVAPGDGPPAIG